MRSPHLIGLVAIAAAACASSKRAPQASMTAAPPPPAPSANASPDDPERDWHWFRPAPLEGTGVDGAKPLYPVLHGRCTAGGIFAKDTVIICGRDVVRIGDDGPVFEPFQSLQLEGDLPETITERGPDDVWLSATSAVNPYTNAAKPSDHFFVYRGSGHRYHAGTWKRFPTAEAPQRSTSGWLVFDLPRFEKPVDRNAPGCGDFACEKVLPLFWSADVDRPPDFKSLEGKIAWIHPYEDEFDWAYFVDPSGPVHVIMRALDLVTNKRVVGVLSWTEKDGARFEALPAIAGDAHFTAAVEKPKGTTFQFVITTWTPPTNPNAARAEIKYIVRRDGSSWSAKRLPPPKPEHHDPFEGFDIPDHGREIEGYRIDRIGILERRVGQGPEDWKSLGMHGGQLSKGSRGDLELLQSHFAFHRSIQPREVLTATESWGHLHPWPKEVEGKDDCKHPFAVFDALEEESYGAIIEEARREGLASMKPWGALPPSLSHLALVELRLYKPMVIVIGASVTPAEANELRELWHKAKVEPWTLVSTGSDRKGAGIYCARPVSPKPFNPPR
jgi:hypothetical protein